MGKYDDDYDDYDDYEDDDEIDDEDDDDSGSSSRSSSSSNPFASRSGGSNLPGSSGASRVSGAGLPRSSSPFQSSSGSGSSGSGSSSSSSPQPFRSSGGSTPSSGGGSSAGSGNRPSPFQSGGSGSSGSGSSGSSGGGFNRPSTPSSGGSSSSGFGSGSGSSGSGSSGSSGGGFNRPSTPSSGGSGSSGFGSGSGSSGSGSSGSSGGGFNRPNTPSSGGSGSSGFGSGSGSSSSGSSSSSSAPPKKDDKKDDKPSGGGLGGFANRFGGGGDKKDDKKDDKKKDDKPAGGGLGGLAGGLTNRFGGGGDKKDDKPKDDKKPSGGGLGGLAGGLTNRFGGGGDKKDDKKKDDKPAGGGLMNKLGGGGSTSSAPASPSSGAKPAFGGSSSGIGSSAAKSESKPASSPLGGLASKLPFGKKAADDPKAAAAGGKAATKSTGAKKPAFDVRERLKTFFNPQDDKKSTKAKISKAPKVEQGGLSLDQKLDIIGVVLMFVSAGILLSSLSASQGAITGSITNFFSQLFGHAAVFVPVAMFAVGVYLLLRHFGDEAPVIGGVRLVGIGLLSIAGLVLLQYADALSYPQGDGQSFADYLASLRFLLPLSADFGRGGGVIGGEIYYFLMVNFGEMLGFLIALTVAIIGIMLTLKLSAAELAIIVLSIGRSFGDSMIRRRQIAAIRRQERAEQEAAKQGALGVPPSTAPQIAAGTEVALPTLATTALPAPIPAPPLPATSQAVAQTVGAQAEEQRTVQFTMRGHTMTASLDDNGQAAPQPTTQTVAQPAAQPVAQPTAPATTPQPATQPAVASAQPQADQKAGLFGRFGRGAATAAAGAAGAVIHANAQQADEKSTDQKGGFLGRFGRGADKPASDAPIATPAVTASAATATQQPPAQPIVQPIAQPIASTITQPAAQTPTQEDRGARLADLMAGKTPSATPTPSTPQTTTAADHTRFAPPAAQSTAQTTQTNAPANGGVQEDWSKLPPAQPTVQPTAQPTTTQPAAQTSTPAVTQQPAASLTPQPFQRQPLTTAKPTSEGTSTEKAETSGLTAPVISQRPAETTAAQTTASTPPQTAATNGAPRIVSLGDDESEAERKKNEIPAPPPSARNASTLANTASAASDTPAPPPQPQRAKKDWKTPDISQLLISGQDQELDHSVLINRAKVIQETLESFGAPGRVVEVRTGPVVTQFGVEPDYILARGKKSRVKVSTIAGLDKDLQLALGAKAIRIEAPVPGKGYVGIEVPNEQSSIVRLRNVMESAEFKKISGPLPIALGESVDGTPVAGDLASMPHLLIAGTTGSGKSVCVNTIIASLLLRNSPSRMKFIMVDPKRVELTQYNGIPHLVSPVVTELERIVSVLKWVTREMDERYRKFSTAGARNIEDYNRHLPGNEEGMPYIVVIIDELADLMMLAPDETEKVITRIAALARATGIHLVIATQRPSVDVVTGLIKANFPARIAFAVAGGVDSRVILDQPGAERLLGRGDMLYMSGDSPAPLRLQGVYVSDSEINNITRHWRSQMTEADLIAASRPLPSTFADDGRDGGGTTGSLWSPAVTGRGAPQPQARPQQAFWDRETTGQNANVQSMRRDDDNDDDFDDGDDAMYGEAVEMVRRLGKASVSLLQRRLRIGYTRAARLIDLMEERGVVGPASEGSKPRDVLTSKD